MIGQGAATTLRSTGMIKPNQGASLQNNDEGGTGISVSDVYRLAKY